MKSVFVDTSAFYALFNRADVHHLEASLFYQQSHLLVTSHLVLIELMSLLTKRQSKKYALEVAKVLLKKPQRIQVISLAQAQIDQAWNLFLKYKDKDYDMLDCTSFICMKENKITEAFSFDKHFKQFGFKKVP